MYNLSHTLISKKDRRRMAPTPSNIVTKCPLTHTEDGSSCGPLVPCTAYIRKDGTQEGEGCGEPCEWIMHPEIGMVEPHTCNCYFCNYRSPQA